MRHFLLYVIFSLGFKGLCAMESHHTRSRTLELHQEIFTSFIHSLNGLHAAYEPFFTPENQLEDQFNQLRRLTDQIERDCRRRYREVPALEPEPLPLPVHLRPPSCDHLLELIKCIMHIPSIVWMHSPDKNIGKYSLYLSQVAVLLKVIKELAAIRNLTTDFAALTRLCKVFISVLYVCENSLVRTHGHHALQKITSQPVTQGMLLLAEILVHTISLLSENGYIDSQDLKSATDRYAYLSAEAIEFVRFSHYSAYVFGGQVKGKSSISWQPDNNQKVECEIVYENSDSGKSCEGLLSKEKDFV